MIERVLRHLAKLIECDSQNPPRAMTAESAMFEYVRSVLEPAGFEIEMSDFGDGHVNLFAVRGAPRVLFNCHLDTVPVGEGWTRPPLELTVDEGRAYGRGSCDIKGAAAVLLALAEDSDRPMAVLFSSDEEGAEPCCVRNFLAPASRRRWAQAIVCEPTGGRAIVRHRGFLSVKGFFSGDAGHSSELRALDDNANHRLARWLTAAAEHCRDEAAAGRPTCFNAGLVSGGTKSNVIAGEAFVHYSARLGPGQSNDALFEALSGLAGAPSHATWQIPFAGPPLPAAGRDDAAAVAFCRELALEIGDPVDFWTEASLFSDAGIPALVLGPGHIAQAHSADEWVALDELERIAGIYERIIRHA